MLQNKLLLIVLIIPLWMFSQSDTRELLKGRLAADSLMVENISVKNISSNIAAVTDARGNFTIYARPADTLQFTGLAIRDAMLVVKREHFTKERLVIKLDVNVTVLDEVIITPLTGNLERDSKNIKGQQLTPQFNSGALVKSDVQNNMREFKYSQEKNMLVDPVNRELHGLNFVNIFTSIFKSKKKKEEPRYYTERTFAEVVQERFSYYFFTETLKIPKEEIGLFLTFCDSGNETMQLLDPQKEFDLTDYLVNKSIEYRKAKN